MTNDKNLLWYPLTGSLYGYYLENDNERAEVARLIPKQWHVYLMRDSTIISKDLIEPEFREDYSREFFTSILEARRLCVRWIRRAK